MAEIEYTIEINPITNYTIELNEQGPQGARGYDGVGISSIDETSSQGLVDTYTITLDDGRTSNFDVTNGFSPTATVTKNGTVATITITDKNGTTTAEVYDGNGSVDDVRLNEVSVVSDGIADIYVDNTYDSSSTAPISGMGVADAGFITGIDSSDVTTALDYTPADEDLSNLSTTGQGIIDNKADVDLSNLSTTGQNILDGKVNKSGDTMTGNLASLRDVTKGTAPSNNIYWQMINLDSAGTSTANRISEIRTTYDTSGAVFAKMMLYEPTAGSTSHTDMTLGYDASKNPYFTFPNSTCVDGQWISNFLEIANGVTAPDTTNLNYSLSSYLPNDGYNYEVLFRGFGATGTTNGDRNYFYLATDIIQNFSLVSYIRTRSAASLQSGSTLILPVGTARTVTIVRSSNNTGTVSLYALGYRRIGTNS